jgi:uncharacterized Zn-binding protein involved in type VI secretion
MRLLICPMMIAALMSISAHAQTPGVVTGGADGVTFNGKPAARQGDTTSDGSVIVEDRPTSLSTASPLPW